MTYFPFGLLPCRLRSHALHTPETNFHFCPEDRNDRNDNEEKNEEKTEMTEMKIGKKEISFRCARVNTFIVCRPYRNVFFSFRAK